MCYVCVCSDSFTAPRRHICRLQQSVLNTDEFVQPAGIQHLWFTEFFAFSLWLVVILLSLSCFYSLLLSTIGRQGGRNIEVSVISIGFQWLL